MHSKEGRERAGKMLPSIAVWAVALGLATASTGYGVTIKTRDNPIRAGMDAALAMDIPSGQIISATAGFSPINGKGVVSGNLGNYFPIQQGGTFTILSTGLVGAADRPISVQASTVLGRLNNPQGKDLIELHLTLRPPGGAKCLVFDYAFYSEEDRDKNAFNDTFAATIGTSPLVTTFASASISNSSFSGHTGTVYDGETARLTARADLRPSDFPSTQIVLSLEDIGDSRNDSAVFIDNFRWRSDPACQTDSPVPADTDGDALLDTWESNGMDTNGDGVIDLDLKAMGADPAHKDIFVEVDYMVAPDVFAFGRRSIPGHSHKPSEKALQDLITAFASAPVSNPDGLPGIRLHIDAGRNTVMDPVTGRKWGALSRSNALPHINNLGFCPVVGRVCAGPYNWTDFDLIKVNRFSPQRAKVFHYAVFGHSLGASGHSGISRDIPASDFIVTLGSFNETSIEQAGTFMHELGHNLSLRHGGGDNTNYKPNYLSVMNYSFQTRGLFFDGFFGWLDYSFEELPTLNEHTLNEAIGLGSPAINGYGTIHFCSASDAGLVSQGNGPIDWNCNGNPFEFGVSASINRDLALSELTGFDDWESIVFDGGAIGIFGLTDLPVQTEIDEITDEEDSSLPRPLAVKISGPGVVAQLAGTSQTYDFEVQNVGDNADTYDLAVISALGWASPGLAQSTLTLQPDQSAAVSVLVNIPAGTAVNTMDEVTLTATSRQTDRVSDAATTSPYVPENPPVAHAGPDQRVECSSQNGTPVTLDGSGSQAPSGGVLAYQWIGPFPEGGGTVSGVRPTVTLPLGVSTITLRVNDDIVDSYPDTVIVNVVDTTPPVISVSVSPQSLWPPDHSMKEIRATVIATDICTPPTVALTSVVSSEPDDARGNGDGHTNNDIQGTATGTPDFLFSVRSERAGSGPGRVYTARYTATDSSGNRASAEDQVRVPHSPKK